ncbi:hypothetical protein LTR56_016844 [Elasticomyces elasticus]|nr:hypothetical protein LTR56_016844 [Elasticomyces elasticus]KAK3666670.1 hypothetical protein LTR22_002619 [Elasticomyces elasticus]KAK5758581.1 hypothetical protein LTS12_011280 [Elasticomyces elasticus]
MEFDDAPPPYEAVQSEMHNNDQAESAPTTVATVVRLSQHSSSTETSDLAHNSFGKVFRRVTTAITIPSDATYVELCESLHSRVMVHFGVDLSRRSVGDAILTIRLQDSGTGVVVADQDEWAAARGWVMDGSASLEFDFKSSMGRLPSETVETIIGEAARGVRRQKVERDDRVQKAVARLSDVSEEQNERQRRSILLDHWSPAGVTRDSKSADEIRLFTVICQRQPCGTDEEGNIIMDRTNQLSIVRCRQASFKISRSASRRVLMATIQMRILDLFGVSIPSRSRERPAGHVAVSIASRLWKKKVNLTIEDEADWFAAKGQEPSLNLHIDFVVPEDRYSPIRNILYRYVPTKAAPSVLDKCVVQ